eukprot:TRINITY_DN8502_c0_g1_i11.p1 TRINITY_DN8502_c0_g1~~TRINITY_DN8502_c0_g1_i11.p1  ORF type:complete len:371 (-),score=75.08 TRINITY_DN8502_c0_g1_i11:758-1870(-)
MQRVFDLSLAVVRSHNVMQQQLARTEIDAKQSLTLMRNLMRTAISSICYLRHMFPEECFQDRFLSGINIKGLIPKSVEAKKLCNWLEHGVFEAIEKRYLKCVVFTVASDATGTTVLESYHFRISYPDNENVCMTLSSNLKPALFAAQTKDEIKRSTATMIRTLITLAQTLQPLPDEYFLSMKLLYYDENVPANYQPKYFEESQHQAGASMAFEAEPLKLRIGSISTPFHTMSLKLRTNADAVGEEMQEHTKDDEHVRCGIARITTKSAHAQPIAPVVEEDTASAPVEQDADTIMVDAQHENKAPPAKPAVTNHKRVYAPKPTIQAPVQSLDASASQDSTITNFKLDQRKVSVVKSDQVIHRAKRHRMEVE